ncbi:MAG: hypothetical protein IPH37_19300 [Burkholderiales bacterium]|nr:hypothetical protein [Burkholderiales bacterium]
MSLFGLMLIVAAKPMPQSMGLGVIAIAASLHSSPALKHRTPGLAGYENGLLTTAALHLGGVGGQTG